jgi:hypothetical protein
MEQEVTRAIDEQQKAMESMQAASQLEIDNKKTYAELLQKGIAPAQAKILIEVDNEVNKIKIALELTRKRVQAEIDVLKTLKAQGKAIDEGLLASLERQYGEAGDAIGALPGIATEETAKKLALAVPKSAAEYAAEGLEAARTNLEQLSNIGYQSVGIANSIGDAFGQALKGMITGASSVREAFAGLFQSIADSFADMVSQMIAEWLKAQLIQGFMNIFSPVTGGLGGGLSSGVAGFGGGFDAGIPSTGNTTSFAGAFKPFANGGIVTGPTLGLVGEGRYNEAVIPLPDGKSVPVDLGGGTGSQITSNIVVNVNSDGKASSSGADSVGLGRKIEGAVKQVIVEELRPGGVLAGRR